MQDGTKQTKPYVFRVVIDYLSPRRGRVIFCRKQEGFIGWYPGKSHYKAVDSPSFIRALRVSTKVGNGEYN